MDSVHFKFKFIGTVHYTTTFLGFFYISANPFIYVLKFHPVRRILVGLIPWTWKKSEQAGECRDACTGHCYIS